VFKPSLVKKKGKENQKLQHLLLKKKGYYWMPLLNIQDIIKRVITQCFILLYGCHVNEISQHGLGIPNVLVQKSDNGIFF
jgi:hypothetical protein